MLEKDICHYVLNVRIYIGRSDSVFFVRNSCNDDAKRRKSYLQYINMTFLDNGIQKHTEEICYLEISKVEMALNL